MTTSRNNMDLHQMLNQSYVTGKLSVLDRQFDALEKQLKTLKMERGALLIT